MAMFGRKSRGGDDDAANKPPEQPSLQPTDKSGTGLPSRALPKIIGVLAVGFALYVAFSGRNTPTVTQEPTAAPTPQTTATPEASKFNEILHGIENNDKGKSHHSGQTDEASSGAGNPLDSSLPVPQNVKRAKANQGNIAASTILALVGSGNTTGSSGQATSASQNATEHVPANDAHIPEGKILSPLTHIDLPQTGKTDTRSESQKFLDQTRKEAGNGYGAQTKILPRLPGAELYPGTVLPATTVTEVNTQLPGTVVAQVSDNVFGRNGRLAVPEGSRLLGRYDSSVTNGQTRVLLAFERIIFPDGHELVLSNAASVGEQGTSGTKADVNNHFFKLLGASLLVALLDEGVSYAGPQQSVTTGSGATFSGTSQAGAQAFAQSGNKILQPYLDIKPTAIIPAGTSFNVMVNKTVVIPQNGDGQ